jgi:hypothetical protein
MPAPKLDTWRPSECPRHGQVHAIWLDGHYGRWSAEHERTRYTCVRFDDAGRRHTHRFVAPGDSVLAAEEPMAAPGEPGPGPGPVSARVESPPILDASTFTIPEIARLLIAVGEGRPLRDCAHDIRADAARRHCAPNPGRARPALERKAAALPDGSLAELPARPVRPPRLALGASPPAVSPPPEAPPKAAPPSDASPATRDKYNYSAPKPRRRVDSSRSASIAMDYVDQYGPAILRTVAPDRWPVYVALGSVSLPRKAGGHGGADPGGRASHPGGRAGVDPGGGASDYGGPAGGEIMVAADCELPGHSYAFHSRLGGGTDKDSWIDFLRSLAGEPTWIVAEPGPGIAQAVAELWPDTVLFACEDRLREELREAATRDGIPDEPPGCHPIFDAIGRALRDVARWQEFVEATEGLPRAHSLNLRGWLDENEALVLSQFFLKKQCRNAPTKTAALRPALEEIREKVLPHAGATRNLWRFNLRLALMSAYWSGLDQEREYVAALNREFAATTRAARDRRQIVRPDWASGRDYGGASSIDGFLAAAEARRQEAAQMRRLSIVPASAAGLASRNAARVAIGLPPILPEHVPVHVSEPELANSPPPGEAMPAHHRRPVPTRPGSARVRPTPAVPRAASRRHGPLGRRTERSTSVG